MAEAETKTTAEAETSEAETVETEPEAPEVENARLRDELARVRAEAAAHRHEKQEARDELDRIRREHETEQERLVREAEERGRAEAEAEYRETVAANELKLVANAVIAKAAGRFADPEDAVLYLPLEKLVAETDERKRGALIEKYLAELLERKPHLANGTGSRQPLVAQGGRSERPARPNERSWLRR